MRFETENRIEFIGWIGNVSAFPGGMALRNPVEPVKAHDMIEAKHPCLTHLKTEDVAQVAIALLSEAPGMQGSKSPILPLAEKGVRRRAHIRAGRKSIAFTPEVVSGRMNAERKVEIELNVARATIFREGADLLVGEPLSVEVIILRRLRVIAGLQHSVAQALRPLLPRKIGLVANGAELGVVLGLRTFAEKE